MNITERQKVRSENMNVSWVLCDLNNLNTLTYVELVNGLIHGSGYFVKLICVVAMFLIKCMFIRFQLVPDTKEGTVFPPLMTVTYSDVPITDVTTQTVSVSWANTRSILITVNNV